MSSFDESVEARIREINNALQLLENLVAKRFEDLTVYERVSIFGNRTD